jgi:hypothetical protein
MAILIHVDAYAAIATQSTIASNATGTCNTGKTRLKYAIFHGSIIAIAPCKYRKRPTGTLATATTGAALTTFATATTASARAVRIGRQTVGQGEKRDRWRCKPENTPKRPTATATTGT